MVKKHLKGMEIGIKEDEVEIKTLWKATCDDKTKNKLIIDFLLMAIEKVLGESVIVYKNKNGKTQFNTAMFLETHDKDDKHKIEIKIRKMLKEALETIS